VAGGVWLRQLLVGRDVAVAPSSPEEEPLVKAAKESKNLMYLVGDAATRECFAVDCCWDVKGVLTYAKRHRMKIVGVIATHYHIDHIGGRVPPALRQRMPLASVPGIKELTALGILPRIHGRELETAAKQSGLTPSQFGPPLTDEEVITLGACELEVLHTPGHSPGSVCLHVRAALPDGGARDVGLLSADTLFPGSCGRLDLPDADAAAMHGSLTRLRGLPDGLTVYPGHDYGGGLTTTIRKEKLSGMLKPYTKEAFLMMHGAL